MDEFVETKRVLDFDDDVPHLPCFFLVKAGQVIVPLVSSCREDNVNQLL